MKRSIYLILKISRWWFWEIPTRFSILALCSYSGLLFLLFGSMNVSKIENIIESVNLPSKLWMFIGTPMFVSFVSLFVGAKVSNDIEALEKVIRFRNGQMGISSDKKASKILQKTSQLDVLSTHDNSEMYEKAKRGFEARFGTSSPTTVFKKLMDE